MKINPVYKKELKLSVRTGRIAMNIFIFNAILSGIGILVLYSMFQSAILYGGNVHYESMIQMYIILSVFEFGLILFIVPALTASAISGERERQTLDILLTTRIKPIQIIVGKLQSSISTILLLTISSLPIIFIVFSLGGVSLYNIMQLILYFVITAIYVGSFGMLCSSFFKKTTVSTVFSFGGLMAMLGGTFFIIIIAFLIENVRLNGSNYSTYVNPDVGYVLLLLLINPAVTFFDLIVNQVGTASMLVELMDQFGKINEIFTENWFTISIIVQLLLSGLFIWLSTRLLDPLRTRTKKIKAKKEK